VQSWCSLISFNPKSYFLYLFISKVKWNFLFLACRVRSAWLNITDVNRSLLFLHGNGRLNRAKGANSFTERITRRLHHETEASEQLMEHAATYNNTSNLYMMRKLWEKGGFLVRMFRTSVAFGCAASPLHRAEEMLRRHCENKDTCSCARSRRRFGLCWRIKDQIFTFKLLRTVQTLFLTFLVFTWEEVKNRRLESVSRSLKTVLCVVSIHTVLFGGDSVSVWLFLIIFQWLCFIFRTVLVTFTS